MSLTIFCDGFIAIKMCTTISIVYIYNEEYIADNFISKILDANSIFETYTFVKKAKDICDVSSTRKET